MLAKKYEECGIIYCGPRISLDAFPLDGETRFFYLFGEILILIKRLRVVTYFCFIF